MRPSPLDVFRRAVGLAAFACVLQVFPAALSFAAPPTGGYWLSSELDGDAGHRVQASAEMTGDAERVFPLDPAAELPGEPVARVAKIQEAMSWIARWAFDGRALGVPESEYALREVEAPIPGATLHDKHQVLLRSLVVTGATPADGIRDIAWPLDQRSILPADSEWSAAALVPSVAPLFAAPAPFVPPASERSGQARRQGGLYLLGYLDRCSNESGHRHCMRWAQVISRDGDRFTPGYLPAYQVAPLEAWVRAPGNLPRGQLIPAVVERGRASFLLLVRLPDNVLHTQMLDLPAHEGGFPSVSLEITKTEAVIRSEGSPPLRVELSPDMDRRPTTPQAAPVAPAEASAE